jgi:hypothetical protein
VAESRGDLKGRIAATNAALKKAKAEIAAARKRQHQLEKMAEKKEKAIAAFIERWKSKDIT